MPDDVIEVKEKLDWKSSFYEQSSRCHDAIATDFSKIKLSFKLWYSLIPFELKDNIIEESFRSTIENRSARTDDWITLYREFWNWAYRHGLVLTPEQFNPLQMEIDRVIDMIERWDKDGLKNWATAAVQQNMDVY